MKRVAPVSVPQGNVPPSCSALTLKNKYPFDGLVSDMVFTFFAFLLVISLSKMALKHSEQVQSSVSKHKAGRVLYGKNTCV